MAISSLLLKEGNCRRKRNRKQSPTKIKENTWGANFVQASDFIMIFWTHWQNIQSITNLCLTRRFLLCRNTKRHSLALKFSHFLFSFSFSLSISAKKFCSISLPKLFLPHTKFFSFLFFLYHAYLHITDSRLKKLVTPPLEKSTISWLISSQYFQNWDKCVMQK